MHPFTLRAVFLAPHAQHVVLIHFPIALFISGAVFDFIARWNRRNSFAFAAVAFWNVSAAACFVLPVIVTGLLAWHWTLPGSAFGGTLRLHVMMASVSAAAIIGAALLHWQARRRGEVFASVLRLAQESAGVLLIGATAHLGGFLSGVNSIP